MSDQVLDFDYYIRKKVAEVQIRSRNRINIQATFTAEEAETYRIIQAIACHEGRKCLILGRTALIRFVGGVVVSGEKGLEVAFYGEGYFETNFDS